MGAVAQKVRLLRGTALGLLFLGRRFLFQGCVIAWLWRRFFRWARIARLRIWRWIGSHDSSLVCQLFLGVLRIWFRLHRLRFHELRRVSLLPLLLDLEDADHKTSPFDKTPS